MDKKKKSIFWGLGASFVLLVFYTLILSLANSFSHALEQFVDLWYWMVPLISGFGIQMGFYIFIKQSIKEKKAQANHRRELAVSTSVSTTSMVACCAHHLVDLLPILGLSVAFLFLARYQTVFLLLGILSNTIGIVYLLEIIQKHSLYHSGGLLAKLFNYNMKKIRIAFIFIAIGIILVVFFIIYNGSILDNVVSNNTIANIESKTQVKQDSLLIKTNSAGGLTIDIELINFAVDRPLQFAVQLNTHQGDLDFDLTKQAILIDGQGNEYQPSDWQGGVGGHHLSGTLIFPMIKKSDKITIIIKDVYNIPTREFIFHLIDN